MKKESLNVREGNAERSGSKWTSQAKGGSLPEGLAMQQKAGDVDGMYARNEKRQRMPKGHDRI